MIQRSRIDDRGREYVLFYAPELMDDPDRDYVYRDPVSICRPCVCAFP